MSLKISEFFATIQFSTHFSFCLIFNSVYMAIHNDKFTGNFLRYKSWVRHGEEKAAGSERLKATLRRTPVLRYIAISLSTRSPFVTLSQRAQSGRWSSFGKRVWFTESHIVLIIYFFTCCFIYSVYSWYKIMEPYIQ